MSDMTIENIVHHIVSVLDSVDLPYQTYSDSAKKLLGLNDDAFAAMYNSIQKNTQTLLTGSRVKSGYIIITGDKGYEYKIIAKYSLTGDRTSAFESVDIERRIPNENFCAQVYLYCKQMKAAPITGDAETIAKRIISRLDENETEEDGWTLGGSFEAETAALFRRILRQDLHSANHTSYEKGSIIVLGDDGLEYLFTSEATSDCGGSEWNDEGKLRIECAATGLSRLIHSHGSYSR